MQKLLEDKKISLKFSNLQLFLKKKFANSKKCSTFATDFKREIDGVVAQLVEQRTENPCVTGSIPVNATKKRKGSNIIIASFFRLCI